MRAVILGYALGIAWLQTRAALPAAAWLVAGCLAGAALAWMLRRTRLAAAGLLALGCACGAAWTSLQAGARLADALPAALEGRDIVVDGLVTSLPAVNAGGSRFVFEVDSAAIHAGRDLPPRAPASAGVPGLLALGWYGEAGRAVLPGQRWRFTVRLARPHGNANPYGFDYEAWLLGQGVRATGYVRGQARLLGEGAGGFMPAVHGARARLRTRIESALAGRPHAPVIVALVIGEQRGIAPNDWTIFARTGVGHLISISGLHITMLAALAAALSGQAWRRAGLAALVPARRVAALAGLLVAGAYVLLAGAGIPAQRTLAMLAVACAALWCGRLACVSHVLALALLAVLLGDPWAVLWPGFWLSFGTVALIVYGCAHAPRVLEQSWPGLRTAVRVQAVVSAGLVPLTALLFSQVSLVSPLANALAIPVVSIAVAPLALAGALLPDPLSVWPLRAAEALFGVLHAALAWLSAWPLAAWALPAPDGLAFAAALAGASWLLAPRGWPARWSGVPLVLPLLLARPDAPPPGALRATVFDVGQGGAVLLETATHRMLYDAGPAFGPGADAAGRVLLPYLAGRGIVRLDGFVLSHADVDHAGGAATLVRAVPPAWTLSSLPRTHALLADLPAHRACAAGQRWDWDGVQFEVLHPAPDAPAVSANARSCVLRVRAGGRALLLTGDIEQPQEAALARGDARADVVLAPHHGSGTSSSVDFLRAVRPELAIFQVGHRNRYRHPKPEVWRRYGSLGIARMRTDAQGAITLQFDIEGIAVSSWRDEHARYWHQR